MRHRASDTYFWVMATLCFIGLGWIIGLLVVRGGLC